MGRLAATILAVALTLGATAARPQDGQGLASYLSLPDRETVMFHDGLDSDELIGAEIVRPDGARLATLADLVVEPDGRIRRAVIDPGSALGAGSRHVIVPIERLRRTGATGVVLSLDMSNAELRALPAYRQIDDRWQPIS